MSYKEGEKFDGEYKNDLRHGNGTMVFKNNDTYEGLW